MPEQINLIGTPFQFAASHDVAVLAKRVVRLEDMVPAGYEPLFNESRPVVHIVETLLANEDAARATALGLVSSSGATVRACAVGIGLDSSTTPSGLAARVDVSSAAVGNGTAHYSGFPGLGYHDLRWLELGGGADTQTWQGDNGATAVQSGIVGEVLA